MRRYERPHINGVWCGDSSAGPYLKTPDGKKRRVYVIALVNDASRMVVGIDVFFGDTFANLMSVLKSAVAKYGVPRMLNFDNGSAYKNRQMGLLAAHSSLQGKSPQDRFFSEPEKIRCLQMQQIGESFLLELERRVSADSVIVIDGVEYEVDSRFAKQRITLRYSLDMKDIFVVERDGSLTPIRLLDKQENASVKREKIHLCGGED